MMLIILFDLFAILTSLIAGGYVFYKYPKSIVHRFFSVMSVSISGWIGSILLMLTMDSIELFVRFSYFFASIFNITTLLFLLTYPTKLKFFKKTQPLIFLAVFIPLLIIPFLPSFVQNACVEGMSIKVSFESIYLIFWTIFTDVIVFVTLFLFVIRTRSSKGIVKFQMKQMTFGFGLFILLTVITNNILPRVFGIEDFNSLGPVFALLPLIFVLNGIINFRLLDIRWILGRSVLFSMLTGLVVWVAFFPVFLLSDLMSREGALLIASLLVVVLYQPLWALLNTLFKKIMRYHSYDPDQALTELFTIVREEGSVDDLVQNLFERFSTYFATTQSGLFILNANPKKDDVILSAFEGYAHMDEKVLKSLIRIAKQSEYKIVEAEEIRWYQRLGDNEKRQKQEARWLKTLETLQVETLIPFSVDNNLVAVLIFGARKRELALKDRDVKFLELARNGIAPALENAAKFEEMKRLYANLSLLDRAKSDFISVVSHRFRTPLSAIRWNVEALLEEPRLAKRVKEPLGDMYNRTLFLIDTLDGLFDSLALESGKLILRKEDHRLQDVLQTFLSTQSEEMAKKGIEFSSEISDITVHVDDRRFLGIIRSLMTNATQYTPAGGHVELSIAPLDGELLEIRVKDTGIGIPKRSMEKIYDKFYRAKNAIHTYADGQGIGLYFVKHVVELHGGTIDVYSHLHKGTEFIIRMPVLLDE